MLAGPVERSTDSIDKRSSPRCDDEIQLDLSLELYLSK